ncbi:MAG: class II fructose-bisphosphatase [Anaerolineae bacterium]|nr:class II fructose-bisphosphatase [Anaerolineae bacterium]
MSELVGRTIALELVRVTEAAALAASRWTGRGDKESVERVATSAMHTMLQRIAMKGTVVIGRGNKGEKIPWLYVGEQVGAAERPALDVAVEPVDGIRLTAEGWPGAVSLAAWAEQGTLFNPGPLRYMEKLAVGPEARDVVDLNAPVAENLSRIAQAKRCAVSDLTIMVLDRPRHIPLIAEARAAGARIRLIRDGDVAAALYTALPNSGIDVLMGIGGAREAVLSACALCCLGGEILCRPYVRDDVERQYLERIQVAEDQVLSSVDLARGEDIVFVATGVTDGEILKGVKYSSTCTQLHSVVACSATKTLRTIYTTIQAVG